MDIGVKGHVVLEAHDEQGRLVARVENHNLWTTLGKVFIAETLKATAGYNVGLVHCAIGVGTATPAETDTYLASEASRVAVSSRTVTGTTLTVVTTFTAAQSTYNIHEIGIFGHSDSTTSANTGKLFARTLLSYDNSAGTTNLTITWTLSVG